MRVGFAGVVAGIATGMALLTAPAGCAQTTPDSLWRVVPGRRMGPVSPTSTLQSLRKALGVANVKVDRLDIGEGETEPGVVLFPTDPTRRGYVHWRDTAGFRHPVGIAIRDAGTKWTLPVPITIGTSIADVEKLHGKPFTFSGFDWDYGGRAGDWSEGKLAKVMGDGFGLLLVFDKKCSPNLSDAAWSEILGDREVSSANKTARLVCPVVDEIWISITPP